MVLVSGDSGSDNIEENAYSRRWYPAFKYRNYRLFFFASIISLNGTWIQLVAEGWLVYEITGSTRDLGITRFLHTIPVTFITLFAGILADKIDKRKILVLTQLGSMIFAGWLTVMGFTGNLQIWHIWTAALGIGVCHSFDIPARQSFIVEMVGKKDLMNALFINSSIFNGARIIGPGIAGIIIALLGPVWCFLINTLSFGATIFAYCSMRGLKKREKSSENKLGSQTKFSYKDALRFIIHNPIVGRVIPMVAISAIFSAPFIALIPSMAKEWFDLGPKGYGSLLTSHGLGSFVAAIILTTLKNPDWKKWIFPAGATLFGLSLCLLGFAKHLWMAHVILALNGFFMISTYSTANTLTQLNAPGEMRGRIMGIYSFSFIGLSPFGNLLMGDFASRFSLKLTFLFGGCICILAALLIAWKIPFSHAGRENNGYRI